jgi:hypothetical protein
MRRLKGTAFRRWETTAERFAIDHAKAIMQEPMDPVRKGNDILRGLAYHDRAETAVGILAVHVDLTERVRGENGG